MTLIMATVQCPSEILGPDIHNTNISDFIHKHKSPVPNPPHPTPSQNPCSWPQAFIFLHCCLWTHLQSGLGSRQLKCSAMRFGFLEAQKVFSPYSVQVLLLFGQLGVYCWHKSHGVEQMHLVYQRVNGKPSPQWEITWWGPILFLSRSKRLHKSCKPLSVCKSRTVFVHLEIHVLNSNGFFATVLIYWCYVTGGWAIFGSP